MRPSENSPSTGRRLAKATARTIAFEQCSRAPPPRFWGGQRFIKSPHPPARGQGGGLAAAAMPASAARGPLSAPISSRARRAAGGRSNQSPNPAALPASMERTPEGHRRVIGTQWKAGSACALAVASHGRLRACALVQGAAPASMQVGICATVVWVVCAWAGLGGPPVHGPAVCSRAGRRHAPTRRQRTGSPWGCPRDTPGIAGASRRA